MNNSTENVKKIKEDILEAAYQVFYEKGYSKANLNEIAAICNTSRTPIYYHFKDKENLHKLSLNILLDQYDKRISQIMYSDETLEHRFDNLIDFFIRHSHELYIWHKDVQENAPKGSIELYQNFLKLQYEKFESIIEIERVKIEETGNMTSKDIATILYLMSNGFFLDLNQDLLNIDTDQYRSSVKNFLKISL